MPKLSPETLELKKEQIEEVAKKLFIQQGFHATSIRSIAEDAEISLGNLYNYFTTKDEILETIIRKYNRVIEHELDQIFSQMWEPLEYQSLVEFGKRVRDLVNQHQDYWLLMYIDVLEFNNQHFRKMFDGVSARLEEKFAAYYEKLRETGRLREGTNPKLGFAAAYMQFFNYFLVEKLFAGNSHLGVPDEIAIEQLARIFHQGVLKDPEPPRQ
ncbi:MAG: TetR/AcrR family transcriptional regulator [Blastocatellia bacterium]|nr:TetR/AcrR family transcriptional regulator [Blastocatellia bacterium]